MPWYQGTESGGWSAGQRSGGGNGAVPILVCAGLVLIFGCIGGAILADSYWGNPPREQAEAERIHIENQGLEERQRIDLEAHQRQMDNEARKDEERTNQTLLWRDRWNGAGIALATSVSIGVLIILGIRVAAPTAVQVYERYSRRREQLVVQQVKLKAMRREQELAQVERLREQRWSEQIRLQRLREECRLEQIRLQRFRTTPAHEKDGGNGKGHEPIPDQPIMTLPAMQHLSDTTQQPSQ